MARSASGVHFGLHGSRRKRSAWSTWRLRARKNDGREQKDCWNNSFKHAGFLSQFSVLSSQFSVLSSQFSVLSSQFSELDVFFGSVDTQFLFVCDRVVGWERIGNNVAS